MSKLSLEERIKKAAQEGPGSAKEIHDTASLLSSGLHIVMALAIKSLKVEDERSDGKDETAWKALAIVASFHDSIKGVADCPVTKADKLKETTDPMEDWLE